MKFDLNIPINSYIFGFLQSDGHLASHKKSGLKKGKLNIELSFKDKDILLLIQKHACVETSFSSRTRDTNFKENYKSCKLSFYSTEFREALHKLGMPIGKKSAVIAPPKSEYSEIDYWRGIIDGDGSLGFTKGGWPFISLNTSSDKLAIAYKNFILKITGRINNSNRNKRDNTYNIVETRELSQLICKKLYYNGCIGMKRKDKAANKISKWKR